MNIFITGGNGFFGSYLIPLLTKKGHSILSPTIEQFDIVKDVLDEDIRESVDIVINLAAYTNVPGAEKESFLAYKINTALEWLLDFPSYCQIYHMSTDYVYDGDTPNSKETDLLNPFNVYGASKAAGDTKLLSFCDPRVHIIRTSFKPIEWPYPVAFDDVYTNADTVDIVAKMVCKFILAEVPGGVYNIGTEVKTVYELARKNNPNIKPNSMKGFSILKPMVSMDLTKYKSLNLGD